MTFPDRRAVNARALILQRNALIALCRSLSLEQTGAVLGTAVDSLCELMGMKGALAYRANGQALDLVAEHGLPRRAQAWLRRLDVADPDPWFVAQRAAQTLRGHTDTELAKTRAGVGIAQTLGEAGWGALAAVPLLVGRKLEGVLVVAAASGDDLDREALRTLEATAGVLAIALGREDLAARERERIEQGAALQLAAVGLMAASVREDLEEPLATTRMRLGRAEELVRKLRAAEEHSPDSLPPGGPPSRQIARVTALDELAELTFELMQTVQRMADMTHRLRPGRDAEGDQTLDLARVTAQAVAVMRAHFDAQGIGLSLVGDELELAVEGRPDELRLLVQQLLFDAVRQAKASGMSEARVLVTLSDEERRHVLAVELAGEGGYDAAAALYDALVVRERDATHKNLGLAIAREIVLGHHGHIEVGSADPLEAVGSGRVTLIRAVFPRSPKSLPPADERESLPTPTLRPPKAASPIVLWIDDDEVWTATVKRFLDSYDVRVARTLAEARLLLGKLTELPDAIFCSVSLVDGDCHELHRHVTPQLAERFVFVSSGVIPTPTANYLRGSGCPTLIKPLSVEEVRAILAREDELESQRISAPTLAPIPGHGSEPPAR
ncbi:MAG: GAF domain-containing protein [Polyangiaceae bacterium]|nr:GAF domain-containing protein [Polyangiaceae bacterium]